MGTKITIKQNDFSHGMQSDTRNKNLVGQTQVFGASKLKHFDIYNNTSLSPVPALDRFNTTLEEAYEIGAIGGVDTIYGLGKRMSNWYGSAWDYRIELTATNSGQDVDVPMIDLSQLSSDFWGNVNSNGSDIRITTSSNKAVKYNLISFDSSLETGWLLLDQDSLEDVYIYFGNSSTVDVTFPQELDNTNLDILMGFDYSPYNQNYSGTEYFSEAPTSITTGLIGNAIEDSTDTDGLFGYFGDSQSVSLVFKKSANPTTSAGLYISDEFEITINASGNIRVAVDTTDGTKSVTSPEFLNNDQWYVITATYRDNTEKLDLYIDGSFSATTFSVDNFDIVDSSNGIIVNSGGAGTVTEVDMITVGTVYKDATRALVEANLVLNNSSEWTAGSLTANATVTKTFSGTQVYTKEIGDSWIELEKNLTLVGSDKEPVYSFVEEVDNNYIFLTKDTLTTSIDEIFGNKFTQLGVSTETSLGSLDTDRSRPTLTFAVDKSNLISVADELDSYENDAYADGVYSAFPLINSVTNYGYQVAMAGERNNRNSIEIWDLLGLDPVTVIDTGVGKHRALMNIKGTLVGIHDNYIDDEFRSYGLPTLDIKYWAGRDNYNTIQSFNYDYYNPTVSASQGIVNNFVTNLNHYSVFHAEPSLSDMGMWAVGKNESTDKFGVSIIYDTSSIGRITQHHAIGNNIIIVGENFELYYINSDDDYSQTSTYESMMIDAGFTYNKKDFNNIEITLDKPLPSGQTISAYYRKNEDDTYVKIFDFTETGEKNWLANSDINGDSFDEFYELQIKLESSGGDAKITEWSISTEIIEEE